MKPLLLLAGWLFFYHPETALLVVDKKLKKPIQETEHYTLQHYLQHSFPVYVAEKDAVIEAADKVVKWIDTATDCHQTDTVRTAHTMIVVSTNCDDRFLISVMLTTRIDESQTSYNFAVVAKEENRRKAQQKILDFATYLDQ